MKANCLLSSSPFGTTCGEEVNLSNLKSTNIQFSICLHLKIVKGPILNGVNLSFQ